MGKTKKMTLPEWQKYLNNQAIKWLAASYVLFEIGYHIYLLILTYSRVMALSVLIFYCFIVVAVTLLNTPEVTIKGKKKNKVNKKFRIEDLFCYYNIFVGGWLAFAAILGIIYFRLIF